jgi:hypothetical protein
MLMYHPAQDVNHCVFRILLILEHTEHEKLNVDVYRLIDFYTLFPSLLKLLKTLPVPVNKCRKTFSEVQEPFESLKNTKRILHELETLQSVAIQNLLAKQLLDIDEYNKGYLKRSSIDLPEVFLGVLNKSNLVSKEWFKALVNEFPKAKFVGGNGLKARTGLMEYRYDVEKR